MGEKKSNERYDLKCSHLAPHPTQKEVAALLLEKRDDLRGPVNNIKSGSLFEKTIITEK